MTFVYRDTDGQELDIEPDLDDNDRPVLSISADTVWVPLDRVEEVVAGIRDIAREAAKQQPAEVSSR